MYAIQATVNGKQIPLFYLDPNVQGITGVIHAADIAMDILNPWRDESLDVHINAMRVR